jgi:AraC-like DNA-binding protein
VVTTGVTKPTECRIIRLMGSTRLTTAEEDGILADYLAGMTGKDIATKHCRSLPSVFRVVKRRGQLGRHPGSPGRLSPLRHKLDELRADYESGATVRELAARVEMSETNVARYLAEHGVAMRHQVAWQPTDEQWTEILTDYRAGILPVSQIATNHGISYGTLGKVLQERGVVGQRVREARGRYSTADRQQMCELYASGLRMEDIGNRFGCGVGNVRKILVAGGITRRERAHEKRFSAKQVENMAHRWLAGDTHLAIAQSYNTSKKKVSDLLRAHDAEYGTCRRRDLRLRSGVWRGGRKVNGHGYVEVMMESADPLFCMAMRNGYALEHRLVMARVLGRSLSRTETVHHINGERSDNRIENLQVRHGRHGTGVVLQCAHCGSHDIVATPLSAEESAA